MPHACTEDWLVEQPRHRLFRRASMLPARFTRGCQPDILGFELVTTAAIHPHVIAGKAPALLPVALASAEDLDRQHELGQFLTPHPVAEFRASLFEMHRGEVHWVKHLSS